MKRVARNQLFQRGLAALVLFGALLPGLSFANHPVIVDPNANREGPDRNAKAIVFKTITAALGAMNGGINQNGTIFVKPGTYLETINITGNVRIVGMGEGVNIEAFVVPADPRIADFPTAMMNPAALQSQPGVIINLPPNRTAELSNVTITNWTDCVRVQGTSSVLLNNVTCRNNINNGVLITDNARVSIRNSTIDGTGFRQNGMTGDFPNATNTPGDGDAINIQSPTAMVEIRNTNITNNFGQAIRVAQGAQLEQVDNLLNNNARRQGLGGGAAGAMGAMGAMGGGVGAPTMNPVPNPQQPPAGTMR